MSDTPPVSEHATLQLTTYTADQTRQVGARLGQLLRAGDVLCLRGDLGAGKTTLVQGVAASLDIVGNVSSPTFTIVQEHIGGRIVLFHMDAYRLPNAQAARAIGFDEYLLRNGVLVVEWPERINDALPGERLDITLQEVDDGDENSRLLTLAGRGMRWANLLQKWEAL